MLIQFRFENFKSFRDDTILDFSATEEENHADHVILVGKEKLLPAAAIFGANASGKTNVIEAFLFMVKYVINSFAYGGDGERKETDQPVLKCAQKVRQILLKQIVQAGKRACSL